MPIRFRKTFKLFPGFRINLSKGGISASIGGRGHSVSIGKRGVRPTVGIPGTGVSYTFGNLIKSPKAEPASAIDEPITQPIEKQTKFKLPLGCLIAGGIIVSICALGMIGSSISSWLTPPTPAPTIDLIALNISAINSAWAPVTQTEAAKTVKSPTSTITYTPSPSASPFPSPSLTSTPTIQIISYPTQAPTTAYESQQQSQPPAVKCCKTCGPTSKPCGDTCIPLNKTCHTAPGCACKP